MKANLLKRLIIAGTLASVWTGINPALAQRTDPDLTARLLSGAKCVSSGSHGSELKEDHVENISVGRQLYTSTFSMRTRGGGNFIMLTCEVDSRRFSTLKLKLGVSDGETWLNPVFTVNVYQAGNKIATYNKVTRGRLIDFSINLEKSGNVALEVICERSTNDNTSPLYVFDAQLIPNPLRISNPSSNGLEAVPAASQTVQPSIIEAQHTTVPSQSAQKPSTNTPNNSSFLNGINGFINDVNSISRSIDSLF